MLRDASISGTVTPAAAKPLAGACVMAIPAVSGKPGAAPVLAETGRAGRYLISDVPPGSYLIQFTSGFGASGYATRWWKDATSRASATRITVTPGAVISDISAALTR